jgi:NAD(P)-dependent dehydrogenase (short-subunit alcohol dehydrogenase family)
MPDESLRGKVALVTGASGGLGEQFAIGLAEGGADVVLAARREPELRRVADLLEREHGVRALAVPTDVTREADVVAAVAAAVRELGRLDVLVSNAGAYVNKPLVEQTLADWRGVIAVNVTAAFLGAREAAKAMIAQGDGGSIISCSSIFAFGSGGPEFPEVGYYAAKGAITALTQAMAIELGPHEIRVNAIAPGFFPTDMSYEAMHDPDIWARHLAPRLALPGMPDNAWIRGAARFLAGDDGRYVTGQTLVVDGGWRAF